MWTFSSSFEQGSLFFWTVHHDIHAAFLFSLLNIGYDRFLFFTPSFLLFLHGLLDMASHGMDMSTSIGRGYSASQTKT